MEQQRADALVLVAETALHHGIDPGVPGERYQVVVHVDAAVLANSGAPGQSVLDGGARVPAETSQRLACDASRVVMRHDADGQIAEVGARTRTIPPALRRALEHRDKGCRFPGCGLPFGQGHHICVADTTARCTKRAIKSRASWTASSPSGGQTGGRSLKSWRRLQCRRRHAKQCAAARRARTSHRRMHVDARLARRAPRYRIRDQCLASAGGFRHLDLRPGP